jgi:pyruvate dehydrogenase E1 component subunit alpha
VLDEDEIEEIKGEAKEQIDEAVEFAEESDEPPEEELYTDVYSGEDEYTGEA